MPFTNFEQCSCPYTGEEFDHVIIGAGAAGIMLAVELARRGRKVLVLESGHFKVDPERQRFNRVVQKGKELRNATWGRNRAVGGTTLTWGGQSLPFSPIDFEHRPWVENSGWPIGFDTIAPWYDPANRFMGVDTLDYRDHMFHRFGTWLPDLDGMIDFHYSKWSPYPDFQRRYGAELERRVAVLYNALTTRILTDGNGGVTGVEIGNYSGSKCILRVNDLVIAAGGIETNRLLLSNHEPNGERIGNHSGWLGRCFMDHPCIEAGIVVPKDPWDFQRLMNTNIHWARKFSKRMSLSAAYQREHQLIQASGSFMFSYSGEAFNPYQDIQRLIGRRLPRLDRLVGNAGALARAAWALLRHRFVYKEGAGVRLSFMLEQEPVWNSHITLSEERDSMGVPLAELHWNITERTWRSMCALSGLIGREMRRLGHADYRPHPHVRPEEPDWQSYLSDVNHHMGGTRMSGRKEDGVVDPHLRVWGYGNLSLVSSSVFPTGSHSNPTLTLLALAQRWVHDQTHGAGRPAHP